MPSDAETDGLLFEQARDIILVIDAITGQIVRANGAAEAAYGYARDELRRLTVFDLRAPSLTPIADQMRQADQPGILFEALHRRKDGTVFPVEVSSRGEMHGDQRWLVSIIRDISERRRFEQEREDLLVATQRALSMRDDFLMIASHELRAPVANLSLQLQQLARLIDRGMPRAGLRIVGHSLHGEVGRLTSLIDALLDAHAARGQLALERGEVDLARLVDGVAGRLRGRADQAGSTMEVEVPSIRGNWDPLRIEQAVTNLVSNALKYGRGRPVSISARLDGPQVHLEVRDQGIGVATEDVRRIFDKFERAVPAHYGGLGLGLFITRQIVEAHRGEIAVDSVPGVGSTFRVMLPQQ